MHFTGTAPQHSRYHFINTDDTQAIVVGIYYSAAQKMEVFVEVSPQSFSIATKLNVHTEWSSQFLSSNQKMDVCNEIGSYSNWKGRSINWGKLPLLLDN